MSRSGYNDGSDDMWGYIRYAGQLCSAKRGRRGQQFFRDLAAALEAMPEKRLIPEELVKNGDVCALGAIGAARGIDFSDIDAEDSEYHGDVAYALNIAQQLAREVEYQNDECGPVDYVVASGPVRYPHRGRLRVRVEETPEARWGRMHGWAVGNILEEVTT